MKVKIYYSIIANY